MAKINELIEQATINEVFDKRTFAELIIKECIDILEKSRTECEDLAMYETAEYYARKRAHADAFESAAEKIKYHFSE